MAEISNDFLHGLRAAYPSNSIDYPDEAAFYHDTKNQAVIYRGKDLPAPFHRGMKLDLWHASKIDKGAGQTAANIIKVLKRKTPTVVDAMRATIDEVEKAIVGTEMRIVEYQPHRVRLAGVFGFPVVGCLVKCAFMDEALNNIEQTFDIGGDGWHERLELRRLRRHALAQAARRENAGEGLVVDPVMLHYLNRMRDGDRRRLASLLRENPLDTLDEKSLRPEQWKPDTLRAQGISIDPNIENIRVKEGRIVGLVRLAKRTTWNDGTLKHSGEAMPDSLLAAMTDQPLAGIVSHPAIHEGVTVKEARTDLTGTIRIIAQYDLHRFPDGTIAGRKRRKSEK